MRRVSSCCGTRYHERSGWPWLTYRARRPNLHRRSCLCGAGQRSRNHLWPGSRGCGSIPLCQCLRRASSLDSGSVRRRIGRYHLGYSGANRSRCQSVGRRASRRFCRSSWRFGTLGFASFFRWTPKWFRRHSDFRSCVASDFQASGSRHPRSGVNRFSMPTPSYGCVSAGARTGRRRSASGLGNHDTRYEFEDLTRMDVQRLRVAKLRDLSAPMWDVPPVVALKVHVPPPRL